jgi:hypothetical protein
MIQTSYYQKSGSLPNAVGISQGVPKWYKGDLYKKLSPPCEIVKIENEATFRRERCSCVGSFPANSAIGGW